MTARAASHPIVACCDAERRRNVRSGRPCRRRGALLLDATEATAVFANSAVAHHVDDIDEGCCDKAKKPDSSASMSVVERLTCFLVKLAVP
jgi:hypothetical protein